MYHFMYYIIWSEEGSEEEEERWGKMDEEEEWEESALISEHLEVKPIRQNAQPEIHRGRKYKI